MTSTQVTGVGSFLMNVSATAFQGQADNEISFSDYMKSPGNETYAKETNTDTDVETYSAREYVTKKEIPHVQKVEENNDVSKTEVETALAKKADQLVEKVAKELGVTVEEIEEAMQTLGVTAVSLFNPDIMSQLVIEVSGENDMLALLTNGDLYQSLNQLVTEAQNMLSQTQAEFSITPGQMQDIIQEIKNSQQAESDSPVLEVVRQEADVKVVGEETTNTTLKETQPEISAQQDLKKEGIPVEIKSVENGMEEGIENSDESDQKTTITDTKTTTGNLNEDQQTKEQSSLKQDLTGADNKGTKEETGNGTGAETNQNFLQSMNTQTAQTTLNTNQTFVNYSSVNAPEIRDQLIEYIKLNAGPEVTQMEIQLQPASLGSINLQLTYRNGAITAQFIAQNEDVKKAIEQQIVQLKTTLEEQGIKIEEVEVTVASHEFEKAMEQGGQWQEQQNASESEKQTSGRKRMVLDELESEEELNDEEVIQVQMMKQNGVTIELEA